MKPKVLHVESLDEKQDQSPTMLFSNEENNNDFSVFKCVNIPIENGLDKWITFLKKNGYFDKIFISKHLKTNQQRLRYFNYQVKKRENVKRKLGKKSLEIIYFEKQIGEQN